MLKIITPKEDSGALIMGLLIRNLMSVFYFSVTCPFHMLDITMTYKYALALHRCKCGICMSNQFFL